MSKTFTYGRFRQIRRTVSSRVDAISRRKASGEIEKSRRENVQRLKEPARVARSEDGGGLIEFSPGIFVCRAIRYIPHFRFPTELIAHAFFSFSFSPLSPLDREAC